MSYLKGNPDGQLYIGNVKWGNDYKHIMLFNSETDRNNFFIKDSDTKFTKIKSNVIYYPKDGIIKVDKRLKEVEKYNYIFYKNDSAISTMWICAFIIESDFAAPDTTLLSIEVDAFQTFWYSAKKFTSFILRATVDPSTDTVGRWLEPESVSAGDELRLRNIDTLEKESDWEPLWVMHCASYYNDEKGQYEYTGVATNDNTYNNTYGEYGRYIKKYGTINKLLKQYGRKTITDAINDLKENIEKQAENDADNASFLLDLLNSFLSSGTSISSYNSILSLHSSFSLAEYEDHRDELVGLYAIPSWAEGNHVWATNEVTEKSGDLGMRASNMAAVNSSGNHYTPRNKKMLTSAYKNYILYSYNGTLLVYKPEAFSDSAKYTLRAIPMGTSKYYVDIKNYNIPDKAHKAISYSSERRVGYDSNTGLNKTINVLSGMASTVKGGASLVTGAATGNAGAIFGGAEMTIGGITNLFTSLTAKEGGFGSNGEIMDISDGNAVLRWGDVSPTYNQCQTIDEYFDVYGYTINRHYSVINTNNPIHITSRPYWNYIQTKNFQISIKGGKKYENIIKNAMDSGVTFWHKYDNFCDYSKAADNR